MMNFQPLSATDRAWLAPLFEKANRNARMRDFSFFSLYMWAEICEVETAREDGICYIRSYDDLLAGPIYALPHEGEDLLRGVARLQELHPEGFTVRSITPETRETLAEHFGAEVLFAALPAEEDYLYFISDLAAFSGRKYAAKRNHIHALLRDFAVTSEPIGEETLADVRALHQTYRASGEDEDAEAHYEGDAVDRVLADFAASGGIGGLLRADDRPVGFFIGEKQGDTLFLHIEKALREVRGAYPMLVRETAAAFADCTYENREEDDGDEGLRRSKQSYCPCGKVVKYRAIFGSGKAKI